MVRSCLFAFVLSSSVLGQTKAVGSPTGVWNCRIVTTRQEPASSEITPKYAAVITLFATGEVFAETGDRSSMSLAQGEWHRVKTDDFRAIVVGYDAVVHPSMIGAFRSEFHFKFDSPAGTLTGTHSTEYSDMDGKRMMTFGGNVTCSPLDSQQ